MAARTTQLFSVSSLAGWTPLPPDGLPTKPLSPAARGQQGGKGAPAAGQPTPAAADATWVRTDDDAAAYFDRHGSSGVHFFYALRQESATGDGNSSSRDDGRSPRSAGRSPRSADDLFGAGGAEFKLRVVPQERVQHAPLYFILSQRTVVRVSRGEHTEAVPLAEWRAHKAAFLSMRRLTFFGSHGLAKCFARWRAAAARQKFERRRAQLEQRLLAASPSLQAPLLEAGALLERVRCVRGAGVQPGRRHSAADWAEGQGAWRSRRAQPELEAAVGALAQLAEGVCARVEARATAMLASVRPSELTDRIGVDLHAATSAARARSMQAIKAAKLARAAGYRRALAERAALPRLLRQLDLRLAGALAQGAAAAVGEAAAVLRAAAPRLLPAAGDPAGDAQAEAAGTDGDSPAAGDAAPGGAAPGAPAGTTCTPVFLCHVNLGPDGTVEFEPTQEAWAAALQGEVAAACLQLAGSQPPLLTLPAFERYQAALLAEAAAGETAAAGAPATPADITTQDTPAAVEACSTPAAASAPSARATAQELAQRDAGFAAGAEQMQALLTASFAAAQCEAARYAAFATIQAFGSEFDAEAWAAQQRAALDLEAAGALLRRLAGWAQEVEAMPPGAAAGLLHLDATGLRGRLAPVVADAQERACAALLALAGERCRGQLAELAAWQEVAAARPLELEPFLAWAGELGRLLAGAGAQAAAAADTDAALELVVRYAGRLPTADAVKRADLREAAARLPGELAAAAAWAAEQRGPHAAAVKEHARGVAEEAVLLEAELQAGCYVDAGAQLGEVVADLELQRARLAQLAAQAREAARLRRELAGLALLADGATAEASAALEAAGDDSRDDGAADGLPWEVRDAQAALERAGELWAVVGEAEALRDASAQAAAEEEGEQAEAPRGEGQLAALQARLAAVRGDSGPPPSAVWLRASTALLSAFAK